MFLFLKQRIDYMLQFLSLEWNFWIKNAKNQKKKQKKQSIYLVGLKLRKRLKPKNIISKRILFNLNENLSMRTLSQVLN